MQIKPITNTTFGAVVTDVRLADLDADTLDALFRNHPDTPEIDPFWDELRLRPCTVIQ